MKEAIFEILYPKENEFTLLSDEQTFGSHKIDVIKSLGTKCAVSDFAILLGAKVSGYDHVSDNRSLKDRTCCWYLSSSNGHVCTVSESGDFLWTDPGRRFYGIRPSLLFSNISDISSNVVRERKGVLEVEYGEYPQYVVDFSLEKTLNSKFEAGRLRKTGKTYTTDSRHCKSFGEKFRPVEHEEFEYNGKKYVRVESNNTFWSKLTNGDGSQPGHDYWLEVSPIVWYVDEKAKMLVSKTLLASGVRFCDGEYRGNFKETEMYMFLNKYFAKDIMPSQSLVRAPIEQTQEKSIIPNTPEIVQAEVLEPQEIETQKKLIIATYELDHTMYRGSHKYYVCKCYTGDETYNEILITWNIEDSDNKIVFQPYAADLINGDLTMVPLKRYTKQFKTEDEYTRYYDDFIGEAEIKFYEDYNVVEVKEALPLLEEKYGQKDFYTIEDINGIMNSNIEDKSEKNKYY